MDRDTRPVIVLGATGYVGGRLVPLLLERGWKVRAAGRSDSKIQGRPWGSHPNLEIVVADALDTAVLKEAMGDHLDFWRVVAVEEHSRLLLRAEMLAPGEALLEFRVQVLSDGRTELRMTPSFVPRGMWGRIYWWIIAPSHSLMFKPMLKQMVKAAGVRVLSGPSCVAVD